MDVVIVLVVEVLVDMKGALLILHVNFRDFVLQKQKAIFSK